MRRATLGLVAAALSLAATPSWATQIVLTEPSPTQPLFGEAEVAAAVHGQGSVTDVTFYVDGSRVGHFEKPPFALRFDFGQLNLEHHIRVVATTGTGDRIEDSLTTPAIEVGSQLDVELVQLFMKVRIGDGRKPSELHADDFEVVDSRGGREKPITFSTEEPPLSAVVVVDASDSMKGEPLRRAVDGAKSVTKLLRPEDEVMVALFSDRLLRATEFTRSAETLDAALGDIAASGGTAVYDHLYFALNRLEMRLGRPVLILLSDGEDVSSVIAAEEVRWRARRSQATLYWLRLREAGKSGASYISPWRDAAANSHETAELESAVDESGGRILDITSLEQLEGSLASIFKELRSQLVLGFQPSDRRHDGAWCPISVRGTSGKLQVTTRAGYVDD